MTEDDTGTGCVSKDASYSITCEEEYNGRRCQLLLALADSLSLNSGAIGE